MSGNHKSKKSKEKRCVVPSARSTERASQRWPLELAAVHLAACEPVASDPQFPDYLHMPIHSLAGFEEPALPAHGDAGGGSCLDRFDGDDGRVLPGGDLHRRGHDHRVQHDYPGT